MMANALIHFRLARAKIEEKSTTFKQGQRDLSELAKHRDKVREEMKAADGSIEEIEKRQQEEASQGWFGNLLDSVLPFREDASDIGVELERARVDLDQKQLRMDDLRGRQSDVLRDLSAAQKRAAEDLGEATDAMAKSAASSASGPLDTSAGGAAIVAAAENGRMDDDAEDAAKNRADAAEGREKALRAKHAAIEHKLEKIEDLESGSFWSGLAQLATIATGGIASICSTAGAGIGSLIGGDVGAAVGLVAGGMGDPSTVAGAMSSALGPKELAAKPFEYAANEEDRAAGVAEIEAGRAQSEAEEAERAVRDDEDTRAAVRARNAELRRNRGIA